MNPTKYIPHWLQKASVAAGMIQVSFPHGESILIDSVSRRYECDCDDACDSALLLEDKGVEIKALPGALLGRRAQPLAHLIWTVQLARLQAELKAHAYPFQAHVLRLAAWPCMTDLPAQPLPLVARICALLSHRPTSALLVPTLLGVSAEQVYPVIEVLRVNGYIKVLGEHALADDPVHRDGPNGLGDRPPQSSFVEKLWQRLRSPSRSA